MADYQALFEQQRQARLAADFSSADQVLNQIHVQAHADASVHMRVHYETARLRLAQRRYAGAAKEVVAFGFAAPASWVQKYLGLVRPNL